MRKTITAFLQSRKLRVDILIIFITLFLFSISTITYYFYTQSNRAILTVANSFINRTLDFVTQRMNRFLQPAPLLSIANLIMNDAKLDAADMKALAAYMHVVLQSYPQLMNAYIADTKGNLFIENRIIGSASEHQYIPFIHNMLIPSRTNFVSVLVSTVSSNSSNVKFIFKNNLGLEIHETMTSIPHFDPRTRPWFLNAYENDRYTWIGIYPFFNMPIQVITVAFPIYVNDTFRGVAAADLNLENIRDAVARFSESAKGIIFIVNTRGEIICGDNQIHAVVNPNAPTTVTTINNPVISAAYDHYRKTKQASFEFDYEGVSYLAQFKVFAKSPKETWEIAAVVPINVFIGSLRSVNANVLMLSILILIGGLAMVVVSAERISRPIMQLADETRKMRRLNFSKSADIDSSIYEVQEMDDAVQAAKTTLASFSKYVPKYLVQELLKSGEISALGGVSKQVTIMFTDINNFTELSESYDPNKLIIHLSKYLDIISHAIYSNNGIIDKYIGDGTMAFWGAPYDDPDQVIHACEALLECRQKIHEFCRESEANNMPVFATRFGLSTGAAIVGNIGSNERINYTAIGDTVNLASRLEEMNKIYGTEILVSEAVFLAAESRFQFRSLGVVPVRGKSQTIKVYELLDRISHR